jgi:hypothetical protein
MPQAGRIRVEGLKEIDRRLGRLPDKLQHKILKEGVKEAVASVIRAAKALAPVETGTLRRSIGVRIKSYQKKQTWVAIVGPRRVLAPKFREGLPTSKAARDPRFYGHLVESGAQPHKQKGVVIPIVGLRLMASQHPGVKGTGFMEDAWKANRGRVLLRLKRRLFVDIERAIRAL